MIKLLNVIVTFVYLIIIDNNEINPIFEIPAKNPLPLNAIAKTIVINNNKIHVAILAIKIKLSLILETTNTSDVSVYILSNLPESITVAVFDVEDK